MSIAYDLSVIRKTDAALQGAFMYFMLVGTFVIITLLGMLIYNVFFLGDFKPLDYENPQIVRTKIVKRGDMVLVTGTKCNTTDHTVQVDTVANWNQLDADNTVLFRQSSSRFQPGCVTRDYENLVPADLPPGTYELRGRGYVVEGNRFQVEEWYTEPFQVIE